MTVLAVAERRGLVEVITDEGVFNGEIEYWAILVITDVHEVEEPNP